MRILDVSTGRAGGDAASLRSAAEAATRDLYDGEAVVVPTDTVYGLAVRALGRGGPARLFSLKRRPPELQIPVLVSGTEQAEEVVQAAGRGVAAELASEYWPGALTLVLAGRGPFAESIGGERGTIGVRCPDHRIPLALCASVGPLATTSANLHGEPTPPTAEAVAALFGNEVALVLDGGACTGSPSTVVDCTGPELRCIRDGRIPWAEILGRFG